MSRLTRITPFFALVIAIAPAVLAQGKLDSTGQRFVSEKYQFSIAIPRGWGASFDRDTPLFVSYPASRALPQGKLPLGGANISIVPLDAYHSTKTLTLNEWATADARGDFAHSTPVRELEMPPESGVVAAIISSHDTPTFGPDDQAQHTVNVFWKFNGNLFAAHLFYPAHDAKGPGFEKVFLDTLRSIRPSRRE